MSDEQLVPDNRDTLQGQSFWVTLLHQLPAILTGLAACIGAWAAYWGSSKNGVQLEQHGQQLGQIQQVVDEKAATIDKTAAGVKEIKAAVGKEP